MRTMNATLPPARLAGANADAESRRWTLPVLLVVASFGPYLPLPVGVRTEQVLLYGVLPFALGAVLGKRCTVLSFGPQRTLTFFLSGVALWTLVSTFVGPRHYLSLAKVFSHLENYLQPVAVAVVLAAGLRGETVKSAESGLRQAARALVVLLALNTGVAALSAGVDLSGILRWFAAGPGPGRTVWELAASMGRFTGVFNQPIECGLAYSLGLLAWGYLDRTRSRTTLSHYLLLVSLLVGGVLSVSKAFIVVGLPVFLWSWLFSQRLTRLIHWRLVLMVSAGIAVVALTLAQWTGLDYFLRLFRPGGEGLAQLLELYTAGRFGVQNSVFTQIAAHTWRTAPLAGLGFYPTKIPIGDIGYLEYFVQGGLVALAGFVGALVVMLLTGLREWKRGSESGRFLAALAGYAILVCFGGTALSVNRFSTLFWTFQVGLFRVAQVERAERIARKVRGRGTHSDHR